MKGVVFRVIISVLLLSSAVLLVYKYQAKDKASASLIPKKPISKNLYITPTEPPNPICVKTRSAILLDALKHGITDVNELKKVAATYDLICYGSTDIDIPEDTVQYIKQEQRSINFEPIPVTESSTDSYEQRRQQECQNEINEYNTCMNEYNTEMAEYNACLTKNSNSYSPLTGEKENPSQYCPKPVHTCSKPYCMGL